MKHKTGDKVLLHEQVKDRFVTVTITSPGSKTSKNTHLWIHENTTTIYPLSQNNESVDSKGTKHFTLSQYWNLFLEEVKTLFFEAVQDFDTVRRS